MSETTGPGAKPTRAEAAATAASYDARSITILSGLEAVRQRPGMYIGTTGTEGLHHLVYEVVDNSIDEALAGYCSRIDLELFADGSAAVTDDGRGIPVDPFPGDGRSAAEVLLTTLHAGGKFTKGAYHVSGGLHGVGLSCVNALSERLDVEIWRPEGHFQGRFSRGEPVESVQRVGDADETSGKNWRGTRVHFLPDARIFRDVLDFSYDVLAWRMRELAFLNPGLAIHLRDHRSGQDELFCYEGGTESFVAHLNRQRSPLHAQPVHLLLRAGGVEIDAALQWTSLYAEDAHSFVNSIRTAEGGTHVRGFQDALLRAVRAAAEARGVSHAEQIESLDTREGLTCVLSLKVPDPQFGGQTKTRLANAEVGALVADQVAAGLIAAFERDPDLAAAVVDKAISAARARRASRRAGAAARHQLPPAEATPEVYRAQFGERSKNWHSSARWIAHDGLLAAHGEMCQVPPHSQALDVCCGSGVVGNSFRGRVAKITGLDITPQMVELAKQRLDEVVLGTVYDIPFPEASFELVCNREVMHLMPKPEDMMREVFRVLKPGGQFVVGQIIPFSAVDGPWMFRIFKKKQPLLYHMFLEEDFRALLSDAGLVDIQMKEYLLWEPIDVWIDTHETSTLHRYEIRRLYEHAPAEVAAVHPVQLLPSGKINDCWRWCIFSARKPGTLE